MAPRRQEGRTGRIVNINRSSSIYKSNTAERVLGSLRTMGPAADLTRLEGHKDCCSERAWGASCKLRREKVIHRMTITQIRMKTSSQGSGCESTWVSHLLEHEEI